MTDKELFKLIGGNKKYIFIATLLQAIGLIANVTIICPSTIYNQTLSFLFLAF